MCLLDTVNVGYSEKTMLNHHVLWLGLVDPKLSGICTVCR